MTGDEEQQADSVTQLNIISREGVTLDQSDFVLTRAGVPGADAVVFPPAVRLAPLFALEVVIVEFLLLRSRSLSRADRPGFAIPAGGGPANLEIVHGNSNCAWPAACT